MVFGSVVVNYWIGVDVMRLIKKVVEIVIDPVDVIDDIEKLMEEKKLVDEDFHYFFQLHEDDEVVVFVELLGYDVDDYAIETGSRSYMLETAVLDKTRNQLHVRGDTNAEVDYSFLNKYPVWSEKELTKLGIKVLIDSAKYRNVHWSEYTN